MRASACEYVWREARAPESESPESESPESDFATCTCAEGVRPEWVKLPEAGKPGFLSLRRGFGTSRRQSRGSR